MRTAATRVLVTAAALCLFLSRPSVAQDAPGYEYRVLATSMTHTMELELNRAAEEGFRFQTAMGGETSGSSSTEVVAVMARRAGVRPRVSYKVLAASRTSTMEKELQAAADQGFEYRAHTVYKSAFGGDEILCIVERDADRAAQRPRYRLLATNKTSTMEKELKQVGAAGYAIMAVTVAKTAFGGKELVAILRRAE